MEAPAITHSKKEQFNWFKDEATKWKRKGCSGQMGKGSRPRTNIASQLWRDNYDTIFKKDTNAKA